MTRLNHSTTILLAVAVFSFLLSGIRVMAEDKVTLTEGEGKVTVNIGGGAAGRESRSGERVNSGAERKGAARQGPPLVAI